MRDRSGWDGYGRFDEQRYGGADGEWGAGYGGGYGRSGGYGELGGHGHLVSRGESAGMPPDRDVTGGAFIDEGLQRGHHAGRGPRNYRRSDARILEDVCEALTRHGDVDATDIEVAVEGGEVTLSGTVDDRRTKRLAEDVAASCAGVHDVHNRLRVSR